MPLLAKICGYIHSQMRIIPLLNQKMQLNATEIHLDTVSEYNLINGDDLVVHSLIFQLRWF